jgi:hypothetical protein
MRKVIALVSSLLLVVTFATPAQSAGAKYSVYQKTLATFSSSATTLTTQQKSQVKAAVDANPTAEKFICTGIRYYDQPMSVNITVRKRAKAACEYAKQLNPTLSTWFQNKPTKARSYAGKVLLTVKSPQLPITLDNLEVGRVHTEAWGEVRTARKASATLSPEITYYSSPMVTEDMLAVERVTLEKIAQLWSEDFSPSNARVIYVHYGDPTERQWLVDKIAELGGLRYMVNDIGEWYDESCGALASTGGGYYTIIQCLGRQVNAANLHVIAHEYTHWYQYSNGDVPANGPTWLSEGGATFYGISVAFQETRDEEKSRLNFLKSFAYTHDFVSGATPGGFAKQVIGSTEAEFVAIMQELEKSNMGFMGASRQYLLGNLASEALVATYGHAKMVEFYESFKISSNWKSSFEGVYGLATNDFYAKLHPYAVATMKLADQSR